MSKNAKGKSGFYLSNLSRAIKHAMRNRLM